jgi:hypothetical protein
LADIRSSQVVAQVEWQVPGAVVASQVIAQVEYVKPAFGEYTGHLEVALTPESTYFGNYVYTGDVSIALTPESTYHPGDEHPYDGDVSVALTPSSDVIVAFCYSGDVTIELEPSADVIGSYGYEGVCTIILEPVSAYSIPIPGFDHFFGYGLCDLTFLGDPPPYYCVSGEIEGALTLEATIEPHKQMALVASGGVGISGEGTVAFIDPPSYTLVASGGLDLGGEGVVAFVAPPTYTVTAGGGLIISGEGTAVFVGVDDIPEYTVVGSGGFVAGGSGAITFVSVLPSYTVVGSGGLILGGTGQVTFVETDITEYSVTGSGGFKVSGLGEFAFTDPGVVFSLVGSGGLTTSGAGLIARLLPTFYTVVGSGGLVVSGEGTDEDFVYQTWVLTGSRRKASIYSNYGFNSYCTYKGKPYGANGAGISILESTADGDSAIHTGLAIGPSNFGTFNKKKLRSVFVGSRNGAEVRVIADSNSATKSGDFTVSKGRAVISRGLIGEELTVNVTDFDELTAIEIIPVTLGSRKSR